jgi:hypothetical protein
MARMISLSLLTAILLMGCPNEIPLEDSVPSTSVKRGVHSRISPSGLAQLQNWVVKQWLEEFGSGLPLDFTNETIENPNEAPIHFSSSLQLLVEDLTFNSPAGEEQLQIVLSTGSIEWTSTLSMNDNASSCEATITASGATISFQFNPQSGPNHEGETAVSEASCEWTNDASIQIDCQNEPLGNELLESIDWLDVMGNTLAARTSYVAEPHISAVFGENLEASGIVEQSRADGTKSHLSYFVASHISPSSESPLSSNNGDLVLSLDIGIDSTAHGCVPPGPAPAPVDSILPSVNTWMDGNFANTHDFAVAIHQSSLEQAIHHTYRAGFLCNSIVMEHNENLPENHWKQILPILPSIGSEDHIKLQLQPLAPPTVSLSTSGVTHSLSMHLFFPLLRVEVYGIFEDTPILLYEIRSSASLALEPRILDSGWMVWDVLEVHSGTPSTMSPIGEIQVPDNDQINALYEETFHGLFHNRPLLSMGALHILPWTLIDARAVSGEQAIFYFSFETPAENPTP